MSVHGGDPPLMTNIANWKMAIEIVDFPMKHGDFPQLCNKLPEGYI